MKCTYILPSLVVLLLLGCSATDASRLDESVLHTDIKTTFVQGGAPAGEYDQGQTNQQARWYDDWAEHLCTIDLDGSRQLRQHGCDNLYYFALPCSDIGKDGDWSQAMIDKSPWTQIKTDESPFKNQWIRVDYQGKSIYAQWEDTGPYYQYDCDYVFGEQRPKQEHAHSPALSALDLSPRSFADLTGGDLDIGEIQASWQFVPANQVPDGPWLVNPTTTGPDWDS